MKCLDWMLFIYCSSASSKRKLEGELGCQGKIVNPCLDRLIFSCGTSGKDTDLERHLGPSVG